MASNGESSTVNHTENESIVSMVDVLEEEKQYEKDAQAVLGGSDPYNCTYNKGYLKRQALYACATCSKPEEDPAGVCLACSLECHDGHTLYELYTKRKFRCDCGNRKFGDNKCKLLPEKEDVNVNNLYNQNFRGTYCTCRRPYPDPEDNVEDEMIQCVVCEDWLHGRHTGLVSVPEEYDEFTCEACCTKLPFLYSYVTRYPKHNELETCLLKKSSEEEKVDVDAFKPTTSTETKQLGDGGDAEGGKHQQLCTTEDTLVEKKTQSSGEDKCQLEGVKEKLKDLKQCNGGIFWPAEWRKNLCKCPNCLAMYAEQKADFLCDECDSIAEYEKQGENKEMDPYQQGLQALQSIDRTQQVEVLTEFKSMKDKLTDYLKKFADNKKVVKEEDIKEFFEGLQANKRQRTSMQHFCR